jgi:Rrf2 family protein
MVFIAGSVCGPYGARVKLSVKSDYAARAVLELARHYPGGQSLRAEDLATAQDLPPNYLVQILIELKAQQIVKSVRGKEGGYLLARPPASISLGDVMRSVHGQVFDTPALSDPNCPAELREAWEEMRDSLTGTADNITFQKLLDVSQEKAKMYYI